MTNGTDDTRPPGEEDVDTGEPITELATLAAPIRVGFIGRLHRRIDRRTLANNAITASWHFPILVMLEFVVMIFEVLGFGKQDDEGGRR